jgi:CheY-like chemotaxis protein
VSYKSPATEQQTAFLVEDYADAREMMKIILEHMGYRVVEAADGIEAIEVAKRERPSVILMDMGLPAMGGYEATKRLRDLLTTKWLTDN